MNAVIGTSLGTIKIKLLPKIASLIVANFVELSEGTKEFTDSKTGKVVKRKFYDGLIFHRVISEFMIQSEDPLGTGAGGPGYKFKDEIDSSLRFGKPRYFGDGKCMI
ncbi:peptidylprolyl isomerase [Candidatus Endomicrobiellum pyrsonymphae]|uniref:peptidylprolyl isomerase n=1 Tax=Candidatus Endomicrobiellum pyrsonymphae TaxID=1408203 RepID=UPI0035A92BEF